MKGSRQIFSKQTRTCWRPDTALASPLALVLALALALALAAAVVCSCSQRRRLRSLLSSGRLSVRRTMKRSQGEARKMWTMVGTTLVLADKEMGGAVSRVTAQLPLLYHTDFTWIYWHSHVRTV